MYIHTYVQPRGPVCTYTYERRQRQGVSTGGPDRRKTSLEAMWTDMYMAHIQICTSAYVHMHVCISYVHIHTHTHTHTHAETKLGGDVDSEACGDSAPAWAPGEERRRRRGTQGRGCQRRRGGSGGGQQGQDAPRGVAVTRQLRDRYETVTRWCIGGPCTVTGVLPKSRPALVHTCTYMHACMHAYIHAHTHTYMHTYPHTYMHAYT